MGQNDDKNKAGLQLPDIVEQPCGLYAGPEDFSSDYDADDYRDWVDQSNGDPLPAPLVVYLQDTVSSRYPAQAHALGHELRAQGALFDADRPLEQMILAGDMAVGWSEDQLYHLIATIQPSFLVNQASFNSWCACVGSIIPTDERLRLLRVLGFNHIRFTLTDLNRVAPLFDRLTTAIQQAKRFGFDKTILDVQQIPANQALVNVLHPLVTNAEPERIRLSPPSPEDTDKVDQALQTMGFRTIGLGWYLRDNDSWWQARENNRLYWTLLGFSELRNPDVIGIGAGALSSVGDSYSLNEYSPATYAAVLEQGGLPVARGVELEPADILRREIIAMILAEACIHVSRLEEKWGIQFDRFFAYENEQLQAFEQTRQVSRKPGHIDINTRGYLDLVEIQNIFKCQLSDQQSDCHAPAHS